MADRLVRRESPKSMCGNEDRVFENHRDIGASGLAEHDHLTSSSAIH